MKTQGVSQRPQQPSQVATQPLAEDADSLSSSRDPTMKTALLPDEAEIRTTTPGPSERNYLLYVAGKAGPFEYVDLDPPRVATEDMNLIALAHMPVEEAANQLLAQHSVSAEEFRVFWNVVESVKDDLARAIRHADAAYAAQVEAEEEAQERRDDLKYLIKKAESLASAVLELR